MQNESKRTTAFKEETTKKSEGASESIGMAGSSLNSVLGAVQKVKDESTKIAVAVEEKSAETEEVTKDIEATSSIIS